MAFYVLDMRDRVIQRVTQQYQGADNKRFLLIEAGSVKQAWAKADTASGPVGADVCSSCRHSHCSACEECSVTQQYSDFWICHCCGALTERVPNLQLGKLSNELGKN